MNPLIPILTKLATDVLIEILQERKEDFKTRLKEKLERADLADQLLEDRLE